MTVLYLKALFKKVDSVLSFLSRRYLYEHTEKVTLLTNPNHIYWRTFIQMLCSALSEQKLSGKTETENQHQTENVFQDTTRNRRKII